MLGNLNLSKVFFSVENGKNLCLYVCVTLAWAYLKICLFQSGNISD